MIRECGYMHVLIVFLLLPLHAFLGLCCILLRSSTLKKTTTDGCSTLSHLLRCGRVQELFLPWTQRTHTLCVSWAARSCKSNISIEILLYLCRWHSIIAPRMQSCIRIIQKNNDHWLWFVFFNVRHPLVHDNSKGINQEVGSTFQHVPNCFQFVPILFILGN